VLANDADADGDALTIISYTQPASGVTTLNTDSTFTYSPNAGFTGSDEFTYVISDGVNESTAATVSLEVSGGGNAAPLAQDDSASTSEGVPVTVGVLLNDSDADGDALTVDALTQATNGTVVLNADSTVTYTPNAGFVGTDSFTYKATDGTSSSNVATVTVQVAAVANVAPVAANDTASTNKGLAVILSVLGNDTDADGDSLTVAGLTDPANGTAVLNSDGTITYTPKKGFAGTDSFTYRVSDGLNQSNVATVTIQVLNRPPVAVNDSASTAKNQIVTVAVLTNDSDPDGDPLTITALTQPKSGKVVLNADGTLSYTPKKGFTGADSFTYRASDGTAESNTATVSIVVK
jgi:hypothetical protein